MHNSKIQVIYSPGTFGNLLRWLIDCSMPESKLKHIDNPFNEYNRLDEHSYEIKKLFNPKILRGHQVREDSDNSMPMDDADKIVISYGPEQNLFVERLQIYRTPRHETKEKQYADILARTDQGFLNTNFENSNSENVVKELYKIRFHDYDNSKMNIAMKNWINDKDCYKFHLNNFFETQKLSSGLAEISNHFDLGLEIDEQFLNFCTNKINDMFVVQSKNRAANVLMAIKDNADLSCEDLDIYEQAYIETVLEQQYDCVLFPYGTNWFKNTKQIIEFLSTYPKYLKHMNPILPWYNGMKNPFYLKGKID